MGNLTRTLTLEDGTVVEDGSLLAVELLLKALRDNQGRMYGEVSALLAAAPEAAQETWRRQFRKASRSLDDLTQLVSAFEADYRGRGLDSAIDEALFRRELPAP